jgi:hypothetical protein
VGDFEIRNSPCWQRRIGEVKIPRGTGPYSAIRGSFQENTVLGGTLKARQKLGDFPAGLGSHVDGLHRTALICRNISGIGLTCAFRAAGRDGWPHGRRESVAQVLLEFRAAPRIHLFLPDQWKWQKEVCCQVSLLGRIRNAVCQVSAFY